MTTTLSDNAAIAAANAVVARLDLGSGPGKVQILTAGDVLLAEGELSDPAADGSAVAAYSAAVAKASHPRQMVEIDVASLTSMLSLTEGEVSILTQDLAPEEPVTTVPDFRARLEAMTSAARAP